MAKAIGIAVVGYIIISILIFILLTGAWYAVGVNGAFQPGVWDVTPTWLGLMIVSSLVAAIMGGYVTSMMTSDSRAPKILAGLLLVLGLLMAIPILTGSGPTAPLPRPDTLPMFEAMSNGKQPSWLALLNPILGAVGVMVGSRLRSGK